MNEYGIENLKKGIEVVIDLTDTTGDVLADGKVNFADLPHVMSLGSIVEKAKSSSDVVKEALDLTDEETEELRQYAVEYAKSKRADQEPDAYEQIAEDAILALLPIMRLVSRFKNKN